MIDSYKAFGVNSLKKVRTKVIYLPAIPYEEFAHLKAPQLSELVKEKIAAEIEKWENEPNALKEKVKIS